jgi:hypothetical protein
MVSNILVLNFSYDLAKGAPCRSPAGKYEAITMCLIYISKQGLTCALNWSTIACYELRC